MMGMGRTGCIPQEKVVVGGGGLFNGRSRITYSSTVRTYDDNDSYFEERTKFSCCVW